MALGERLRFFRRKQHITQKDLGQAMGFPEKSSDIRVAQYESGVRFPKNPTIKGFAEVLGVSPRALNVPDIEDPEGVIHTFFALEDLYGLRVGKIGEHPFLFVDETQNQNAGELHKRLLKWADIYLKFEAGEISKDEYDTWRYRFGLEKIP